MIHRPTSSLSSLLVDGPQDREGRLIVRWQHDDARPVGAAPSEISGAETSAARRGGSVERN